MERCCEKDSRSVLGPMGLDESVTLGGVPALQLEIACMPAWSRTMAIDKQERYCPEERYHVQRQRQKVSNDAVPRERLERPEEQAALVLTRAELGLALLYELALAMLDKGGVEDLLQRWFQEERLREEGEEEYRLCANQKQRKNGAERSCQEG